MTSPGQKAVVATTYVIGVAAGLILHLALGLDRQSALVTLFIPVPFCLLLYTWFSSKDEVHKS